MTKKEKERRLNQQLSDIMSESQAVDSFIYLTNKSRGACTTVKNIRNQHANRGLGSLLRRLDPIAFEETSTR